MDNVKRWLSGEDQISDSKIVNINEVMNNEFKYEKYKIVKWEQQVNLNEQQISNLLNYLENGGLNFSFFFKFCDKNIK